MDLAEIIMEEHSKVQAEMVADLILQRPELLDELMEIIFADKEPLSRRAAWPLRFIYEKDEQLLNSYLPIFIKKLPDIKSVAVQRNLLYILAYSNIPQSYHGELLQCFFEILTDTSTSVASLIYSMDGFYNISKNEPDLLNELVLIIHQIIPVASAGVKSKSMKILRKIERSRSNSYNFLNN